MVRRTHSDNEYQFKVNLKGAKRIATNPARDFALSLFSLTKDKVALVAQTNFSTEKELQHLVEANLGTVFSCRLVASEFPTGCVFYLSWIHDHRGDFEIAAQKSLGPKVEVDWSDVRSFASRRTTGATTCTQPGSWVPTWSCGPIACLRTLFCALSSTSVDAVLLFTVLTCVPTDDGQQAIVREAGRVLRPGGLLYIRTSHPVRMSSTSESKSGRTTDFIVSCLL